MGIQEAKRNGKPPSRHFTNKIQWLSMMVIDQIKVMMKFMGLEKYVIPTFNISFPYLDLAMVGKYRLTTVWRIHDDGLFSYEGNGYLDDYSKCWKPAILLAGIDPKRDGMMQHYLPFINRAHEYLLIDCKKLLSRHDRHSDVPNTIMLLKRFHNLDFITI